ncbi:MAG: glutamine--tRNA ligase/YqeY domain fusion protein [Planctomycetota bacterium]
MSQTDTPEVATRHFIQQIIDAHIESGRWGTPGDRSVVRTRFPPEPNGYLHVGHAKSIWLNFGIAAEYGGSCQLRFDDTNPEKEEDEFVRAIIEDVRWLGFRWLDSRDDDPLAGVRFASDYFQQMYDWAVELVEKGLAYVDEQTPEQIREQRGSVARPGAPSPHRDRPASESLELLTKMKDGEVETGTMVLRAKIDMTSPNMNMRDPVMYRVLRKPHHRTGAAWSIYPMYDWAHGLEDSIEGITNSICTLEFEDHRPLYDWFINAINKDRAEPIHHPQQTEFSRLAPSYVVTSKRKLMELVQAGHVGGWDDPRMPTISGLRRRGYTPESLRAFSAETGVTKFKAVTDIGRLENAARDHLNDTAPRRMGVLRPLKVVIESWPEGEVDWLDAINNPEDDTAGTRTVPFTRELYIERDDFMEDAPKKFFRLAPGREVRLRYGYWITCTDVIKDEDGNIVELRATHDPQTRGGDSPPPDADGKVRKVKGTLHWVSAAHAVEAEVRLVDRLFTVEQPDKAPKDAPADWDWKTNLNPDSMTVIERAFIEPAICEPTGEPAWADGIRRFQFERLGYFCIDPDSTDEALVFNRTVTLKDSWAKARQKG